MRIAVGYNNINYEYDANGIRISKSVGNNVTKYIVDGSTVMRQKWNVGTNNYIADYFYDESGQPFGFAYSINGGAYSYYFYETNLQGDIIAIYDINATKVATFNYDAWGYVVYTWTNASIERNPFLKASLFRYRGYIYDIDTGLYYLQSRYYDPQTGRFINVDGQISGVGGEVLGYNMFAYCMNNPVNMSDPTGNWPECIKNSVKWIAKNIVMLGVEKIQNSLAKFNLSYSTGTNVSGTPGAWIFNGEIGLTLDTKGNIAVQMAFGGGITSGTPSASITRYISVTNAHSLDELNGLGYQIGGSALVPFYALLLAIGMDINLFEDRDINGVHYGYTTTAGFGVGEVGAEGHIELG